VKLLKLQAFQELQFMWKGLHHRRRRRRHRRHHHHHHHHVSWISPITLFTLQGHLFRTGISIFHTVLPFHFLVR
jgi:hypothetical protein